MMMTMFGGTCWGYARRRRDGCSENKHPTCSFVRYTHIYIHTRTHLACACVHNTHIIHCIHTRSNETHGKIPFTRVSTVHRVYVIPTECVLYAENEKQIDSFDMFRVSLEIGVFRAHHVRGARKPRRTALSGISEKTSVSRSYFYPTALLHYWYASWRFSYVTQTFYSITNVVNRRLAVVSRCRMCSAVNNNNNKRMYFRQLNCQ